MLEPTEICMHVTHSRTCRRQRMYLPLMWQILKTLFLIMKMSMSTTWMSMVKLIVTVTVRTIMRVVGEHYAGFTGSSNIGAKRDCATRAVRVTCMDTVS